MRTVHRFLARLGVDQGPDVQVYGLHHELVAPNLPILVRPESSGALGGFR